MTARDLILTEDKGKIPALFLSRTMPCLAASSASAWFSGEHTSLALRLPYNRLLGSPSKNPSLIRVAKLLEIALSTSDSFRSPFCTAASVCWERKDPQFKSTPANIALAAASSGVLV
uniref:Uncharacterized protein n=1 Tax=Opuntia streptacantha TaxID=393608 RepID=A0A7C9AZY7_OPUST